MTMCLFCVIQDLHLQAGQHSHPTLCLVRLTKGALDPLIQVLDKGIKWNVQYHWVRNIRTVLWLASSMQPWRKTGDKTTEILEHWSLKGRRLMEIWLELYKSVAWSILKSNMDLLGKSLSSQWARKWQKSHSWPLSIFIGEKGAC